MRSTIQLALAVLLGTPLSLSGASAQTYEQRMCGSYMYDFGAVEDPTERRVIDVFENAGAYRARGATFEVRRWDPALGQWVFVDNPRAGESGFDKGCVRVDLEHGQEYRVRIKADAVIAEKRIRVFSMYTEDRSTIDRSQWHEFDGSTSNSTVTFQTSGDPRWNIAALAAEAQFRSQADFLGRYDFVLGECPTWPGHSCYLLDEEHAYIHESDLDDRRDILKVMGANVWHGAMNGWPKVPNVSLDLTPGTCDGVTGEQAIHSHEFQSAASTYGWMEFWVAMTLNDTGDDDCTIPLEEQDWIDWNHSGTQEAFEDGWVDCEEGDFQLGLPDYNYYGQFCADGSDVNQGTAYDWTRLFWDLHQTGMSVNDLLEIIDDTNSHTWNADGLTPHSKNPARRFDDAFVGNPAWVLWHAYGSLHGGRR